MTNRDVFIDIIEVNVELDALVSENIALQLEKRSFRWQMRKSVDSALRFRSR